MKRVYIGETNLIPLNLTFLVLFACAGCSGTRPWLRGSKDPTPPPPQLAASTELTAGEQQPPNPAVVAEHFDRTAEQRPPTLQAPWPAENSAEVSVPSSQPLNDTLCSTPDARPLSESLSTYLPQASSTVEKLPPETTNLDSHRNARLSGVQYSNTHAVEPSPPAELASASSESETATPCQLRVTGVRPNLGPVRLAVFTDPRSFPNPESAAWTSVIQATEAAAAVTYPNRGRLAVAAYQDLNNDGELNRNRFGIPLEPFAFSNNATGKRGPPTFEQAAVDATPRSSILLTLP